MERELHRNVHDYSGHATCVDTFWKQPCPASPEPGAYDLGLQSEPPERTQVRPVLMGTIKCGRKSSSTTATLIFPVNIHERA